jgi:hypothetical protein
VPRDGAIIFGQQKSPEMHRRNRRCSLSLFDCATLLEVVADGFRRGLRRVEAVKLLVQVFPFTAQQVAHSF